jgi:hypothetical protein
MKRALLMALRLAFFTLLLPMAVNASAQRVAMPGEPTCNVSGTVTVTVADLSGAVIPNAFVLFRKDQLGAPKAKPFLLELRTNSAGTSTASVPCGYVDFFVAADGFAPHAAKLVVTQDSSFASVRLDVYAMAEE